jgi:hypothetical protein
MKCGALSRAFAVKLKLESPERSTFANGSRACAFPRLVLCAIGTSYRNYFAFLGAFIKCQEK